MKKLLTILIVTAMLGAMASCGQANEDPAGTESTGNAEAGQVLETQPDPLAPTDEAEQEETEAPAEETAPEAAPTEAEQVDPLGTGSFTLDDNGAVVFTDDAAAESDRTLIAAAQSLFETACETEFKYTVGCPYDVDTEKTITNDYGWTLCLITDPSITSVADVLADYHKVFSSKRDDSSISPLYIDGEDGVYALCGGRGSDIYYTGSKVSTVDSRSDSEIVFTVENYYDGSDWGDAAYTETSTFSMVLEDGAWRVGEFTLPC